MGGISSIFGGSNHWVDPAAVSTKPFDFGAFFNQVGASNYGKMLDEGYQRNYQTGANAIQDLMSRRGMLYSGPAMRQLGNFGAESALQNRVAKQDWMTQMAQYGLSAEDMRQRSEMFNAGAYNTAQGNYQQNRTNQSNAFIGMIGQGLGGYMGSRA